MKLDLSEAVEAAAAAQFDIGQAARRDDGRKRPDGELWQWSDLTKHDQHAHRVLVLPMVTAAMAPIARQAWAEGARAATADYGIGSATNPYETAVE